MKAQRGKAITAILAVGLAVALGSAGLAQFGGSVRAGPGGIPVLSGAMSPLAARTAWNYGSIRAGSFTGGVGATLPGGYLRGFPGGYSPLAVAGGPTYYAYNGGVYAPSYYGGTMVYGPVAAPYGAVVTGLGSNGVVPQVFNGQTYYNDHGLWYRPAYYGGVPAYQLVRGPGF